MPWQPSKVARGQQQQGQNEPMGNDTEWEKVITRMIKNKKNAHKNKLSNNKND